MYKLKLFVFYSVGCVGRIVNVEIKTLELYVRI